MGIPTNGPHGNHMFFFSRLIDFWALNFFLFTILNFFVTRNEMMQKTISVEAVVRDYQTNSVLREIIIREENMSTTGNGKCDRKL